MNWHNKIVWTEGMFLRPQHFQQHDRYMEALVQGRCAPLHPYAWGFTALDLDPQLLALGKCSIKRAKGAFPDGTPFDMPGDYPPPEPLDVPAGVHDTPVYLALPARRPGVAETVIGDHDRVLARCRTRETDVTDDNAGMDESATLQVADLQTRLLLGTERRDEFVCLGVASIVEMGTDKPVKLDDGFIPPLLDVQASSTLTGLACEIHGLLGHRAQALAGRVAESGTAAPAEVADFLLLQVVNRFDTLIEHLSRLPGLHPVDLYARFLELAGELATFTRAEKRPIQFPQYDHEDLKGTFADLIAALRQALSMVLEQKAVRLPLEERKYGIHVSPISDRNLLKSAQFVLAVRADLTADELRELFPGRAKMGPVEQIRDLVNLQLPGIALDSLPVAPREIPFHRGAVYFALDRSSRLWGQLAESGGFALHASGEFPGLDMSFWAIRD